MYITAYLDKLRKEEQEQQFLQLELPVPEPCPKEEDPDESPRVIVIDLLDGSDI